MAEGNSREEVPSRAVPNSTTSISTIRNENDTKMTRTLDFEVPVRYKNTLVGGWVSVQSVSTRSYHTGRHGRSKTTVMLNVPWAFGLPIGSKIGRGVSSPWVDRRSMQHSE
jgi:hypothetical protein